MLHPRICTVLRRTCPTVARLAAPLSSSSSLPPFDPSDTATVFSTTSSARLLGSALLFEACGRSWLVDPLKRVLTHAMIAADSSSSSSTGGTMAWLGRSVGGAVTWTTKATIFRVFAAGEALEDCAGGAADLGASGVGLIVDHSKEEAEDEWAHNLEEKVALLSSLRASLGERVVFVPVKVTSLADPSMLEAVTAALASHAAGPESGEGGHGGGGGCTEGQIQLARSGYAEGVLERELDGVNRALLERAEDSLGVLLEAAQREDLPLLLDAEQRWEVACRETETVSQRQLAPTSTRSISHASLPLLQEAKEVSSETWSYLEL